MANLNDDNQRAGSSIYNDIFYIEGYAASARKTLKIIVRFRYWRFYGLVPGLRYASEKRPSLPGKVHP